MGAVMGLGHPCANGQEAPKDLTDGEKVGAKKMYTQEGGGSSGGWDLLGGGRPRGQFQERP